MTGIRIPCNWRLGRRVLCKPASGGIAAALLLLAVVGSAATAREAHYRLLVFGPGTYIWGDRLTVKAMVVTGDGGTPVPGARISAHLSFESGAKAQTAGALTNDQGTVVIWLAIPDEASGHAELTVAARHRTWSDMVREDLYTEGNAAAVPTTDRNLYEPGQTVHVRIVALQFADHIIPGERGRLRVEGPDSSLLHEEACRTDDFGIAACDWAIPPDARPGAYQLVTALVDRESEAEMTFRVGRYDLPEFDVNVATDRPYYFPGQQPIVSVIGRYLFGEPLARGSVRIIEPSRAVSTCNEEAKETLLASGVLSEPGRFQAALDLSGLYPNLGKGWYSRFGDVALVAVVTDDSTGKAAERRFDIRVTRDPIHVYLVDARNVARHGELRFFVTTFFADDTPARCTVKVTAAQSTAPLAVVGTNRFGLAEVRLCDPPCEPGGLTVTATDADGRTGRATKSLHCRNGPWLILETAKTILRPGAPIDVQIRADPRIHEIALDVVKSADQEVLLASRTVPLAEAQASLTIPYRPSFRGELSVIAYPVDGTADPEKISAQAPIIYPTGERLHLDLATDCERYLPDEEGAISMRTFDATGRPINAAVGLVAVDRALEKLEGEEQGDPILELWSWLAGDYADFNGLSVQAIAGCDPKRPFRRHLTRLRAFLLAIPHCGRDGSGAAPPGSESPERMKNQTRVT